MAVQGVCLGLSQPPRPLTLLAITLMLLGVVAVVMGGSEPSAKGGARRLDPVEDGWVEEEPAAQLKPAREQSADSRAAAKLNAVDAAAHDQREHSAAQGRGRWLPAKRVAAGQSCDQAGGPPHDHHTHPPTLASLP